MRCFFYFSLPFLFVVIYSNTIYARPPSCFTFFNKNQKFIYFSEDTKNYLNNEFSQTIFSDNLGRRFKVDKLPYNIEGNLKLDFIIRFLDNGKKKHPKSIHTSYEYSQGEGTRIDYKKGLTVLEFSRSNWEFGFYQQYKGKGLIKQALRWWLRRLKVGSKVTIYDISQTSFLRPDKLAKYNQQILNLVSKDSAFSELWELYETAYHLQNPKRINPANIDGFLGYIYDMFSVWGRIMRPEGIRSNYSSPKYKSEEILLLSKTKLNVAQLQQEQEFIKSNTAVITKQLTSLVGIKHRIPNRIPFFRRFSLF